jgi:SAM-dependent methyltransferase
MAKSYEELMGALGRGIFFRPERRKVRELLSRNAEPELLVNGQAAGLFDLSMNGVSFLVSSADGWAVGDDVELSLLLHGQQVYGGRARVARVEPGSRGARVGVGLVSGFLDLPDVRWRDDENQLERDLHAGLEPERVLLPARFREATERAIHFLQFYRSSLGRHEARYRASGHASRIGELAARAVDALRTPWNEICYDASEAARECLDDPRVLRAAKSYTETVVTPLVVSAPMPKRSYDKPLGYPGDYRVMLYYYANALEGDTVFDQIVHKYFVEHPLSNGVRTRSAYMVDRLLAEHVRTTARRSHTGPFRIASLGCGPAREVPAFHARSPRGAGEVAWTLVDQEDEALSVAFHDGQRAIAESGANATLRCLNVSFVQILNEPALMPLGDKQHVIFSTGLFDYLSENRARALIAALYDRLEPGGLLAVANAMGPNSHFWPAEFILDWTLLYRTKEEMTRLGADLPATAERHVVLEPGNAYYFILVRKH